MKLIDFIKAITAVIGFVALMFSGFFFIEDRYVHKPTFFALEKRVSLNELRRQLRQAEDDEAYYERLLRKYPEDNDIKKKLGKAKKRVKKLEDEIEKREKEESVSENTL